MMMCLSYILPLSLSIKLKILAPFTIIIPLSTVQFFRECLAHGTASTSLDGVGRIMR